MSIIRVVMVLQNLGSTDPSWDYVHIANWNSIEVNLAIVVTCLIVLKPLFRKFAPKLFTTSAQGPVLGEEYHDATTRRREISASTSRRPTLEIGGGEVLGNEKQLLGSDASSADVESQVSSSGGIGHMARDDRRATES